jgi:hypothetical protein
MYKKKFRNKKQYIIVNQAIPISNHNPAQDERESL